MKNKWISIGKHIGVFALVWAVLYLALVAMCCIPNEALYDNMVKSALHYKDAQPYPHTDKNQALFAVQDNYADSILLGIAWRMGAGNPFVSALDTCYYDGEQISEGYGLYKTVTENVHANTDYTRYWHGMSLLVRPMHLFTDVSGIKNIGLVFVALLALGVLALLICRKHFKLAAAFLLSLLCIQIWHIRLSMEYQPPFILGFLFCILFILFERKGNEMLSLLSVISGACIAFFDFLTTETVTLVLPLLLVIALRASENRLGGFKENIGWLARCAVSWMLSYGAMFLAKWAMASVATGESVFALALSSAAVRVEETALLADANLFTKLLYGVFSNFSVLFGSGARFSFPILLTGFGISVMVLGSVLYLFRKPRADAAASLLFLVSSSVFLRYLVLHAHSYRHCFFTYRALICFVFAVLAALALYTGKIQKQKKQKRGHKA